MRPGAVTKEMVEDSTGMYVSEDSLSDIRVSGALDKHYAPSAKVILDQIPQSGQGFIALANFPTPEGVIRIASPKDIVEFAQILYESLRKVDILELKEVAVSQPQGFGLAIGVRDRLKKAAQGQ